MNRFQDWPRLLVRHVAAARGLPFVWGERDCCLWAADGLLAYTGIDPAAGFRGAYDSERGAYAAMRQFSGGGVAATAARIAQRLRWPEIRPRQAQRGDAVVAAAVLPSGETGDVLGLISASGVPVVFGRDGLIGLSLAAATRAWRV
jgi:hypothetical protein